MKKIALLFLILFSFIGIVNAESDILKKEKEVAKVEINDNFRIPKRKYYYYNNEYFIIDEYEYLELSSKKIKSEMNLYLYDNKWNKKKELLGLISSDVRLSSSFFIDDSYYVFNQINYFWNRKSVFEINKLDRDFNRKVLNFEYYRNENTGYYDLSIEEMYFDNEKYIYFLTNEFYYTDMGEEELVNDFRILRIDKDLKEYTFLNLDSDEVLNNAPDYFKQIIIPMIKENKIDGDNNYFVDDERVLVSGDYLSFYDNLKKIFEIKNDEYVRFGRTKIYNDLIIVIGYKNYAKGYDLNSDEYTYGLNNSDILFYDLNGNLIAKYEHNAYDFDFDLIDNYLVVSNLYVDGICNGEYRGGNSGGYFSFNSLCNGTLQNEIYAMDAQFLGMALGSDEEDKYSGIVNPDTLVSFNDFVIICFIIAIVMNTYMIFRRNFKKI